MESLINLINKERRLLLTMKTNLLDFTQFIDTVFDKFNDMDAIASDAISDDDNEAIRLFINLIDHPIYPLTLEELRSIKFERFNDTVQQTCLNYMLSKNIATQYICVLLDKIKSVNYGDYWYYPHKNIKNINPLIHCCCTNKFDLVKLLVEKYGADVEHPSRNNTTAIMFCAQQNNLDITKYLYNKGAKFRITSPECSSYIHLYAHDSIKKFILECEDTESKNYRQELEELKARFTSLENDHRKLEENFWILLTITPDNDIFYSKIEGK